LLKKEEHFKKEDLLKLVKKRLKLVKKKEEHFRKA